MKTSSRPDDTHSFPDGFDGPFLTQLRVIQAALAAGVAVFGGAVVAIRLGVIPVDVGGLNAETTRMFSLVHLALFAAALGAGPALKSVLLSPRRGPLQPGQVLAAILVRLALLEGAAFFGLVTLLLIDAAVLRDQPIWWANLASPLLFLATAIVTYPDSYWLRNLLRRHGQGSLTAR